MHFNGVVFARWQVLHRLLRIKNRYGTELLRRAAHPKMEDPVSVLPLDASFSEEVVNIAERFER